MAEVDLILVFERDNPCNTTITDGDSGKIVYQVATTHGKETTTCVKNAAGETIASWQWRDIRSDIITIGNGTPIPTSAWLKKSLVPFKDTVTLQDHVGRNLKWKGNGTGLSLELYSEDDKRQPMVRFKKSVRSINRTTNPPTTNLTPAKLLFDSRGAEIQDLAVISFLVLEKSRRTTENSTLNRTDAVTVAGGAVGGAI